MIDRETVRKIKDAADIVEVVSDYVRLVKRGSNYMGLCPFHNEKTPSFSVNRNQNFCYCFSCHKGGSPVNFIMEKEGISYHDALLQLADKYGIKVEERELTEKERAEQSERESMLIVNEWAMHRMQQDLIESAEGQEIGLQYLYQRGITDEAIKKFKLGYAFDKGNVLEQAALKSGYDVDVLVATGLCGKTQDGRIYDRFRGRVIFPILNSAGKVLAFGGRAIKGELAKYINSPESLIYKKSNELYGIFQAKNAIARQDKCFLVEGYMDVIGMWQSGIENVVASSGTALTDGQIALIHRFSQNVTLIYDGDLAGIKASMRGIDMLLSHNLNVKLLLLPDGDDPDSFARKHTPEEFREYVEANETDFIRFKTSVLLSDAQDDPLRRAEAIRSVVRSVASVSDLIKRTLYIQECSRMFEVGEKVLTIEIEKMRNDIVDAVRRRKDSKDYVNPEFLHKQTDVVEKLFPSNTGNDIKDDNRRSVISDISEEIKLSPTLMPLEREVLRMLVRYGMLPLMEEADVDGNTTEMNVYEYIRKEMMDENISFTNPVYLKVFSLIELLNESYPDDLKRHMQLKEPFFQSMLDEGFNAIASENLSMGEIEIRENQLKENIDHSRSKEQFEYGKNYISAELASHENDEVRRTVNLLITERHRLSRYHEKTAKVKHEYELLDTRVPRVVWEWKDGILADKLISVKNAIVDAVDSAHVDELLAEMQRIMRLRSDYARFLGERIIVPPRK